MASASDLDAPDSVALVPAAGRGERLGPGVPKSLRHLDGVPLVVHAVRRLAAARSVGAVVVAAPQGAEAEVAALLAPVVAAAELIVVAGGATRQSSVAAALRAAPARFDIVLVHDAARALAPPDLADEVAAAVRAGHPAVIPVLPVVDTVKQIDAAGIVVATVDRESLRLVQTPQGFRREVLVRAHEIPDDHPAGPQTDDAGLVELLGLPVLTVPGRTVALKITRPFDLTVAAAALGRRDEAVQERHMRVLPDSAPVRPAPAGMTSPTTARAIPVPVSPAPAGMITVDDPRPVSPIPLGVPAGLGPDPSRRLPCVGIGTDVHAYDDARECWVAGLRWPDVPGLAGHSDGDVAAHAACDALFSAAGLGDLGSNFGTGEPRWAGATGSELLAEAAGRVRAEGYHIGNVAIQIVGVTPRLGPRRDAAEIAMSVAAGARVTLSATTTDRLGFTGRGEGLAAIATALLLAP